MIQWWLNSFSHVACDKFVFVRLGMTIPLYGYSTPVAREIGMVADSHSNFMFGFTKNNRWILRV